MNAKPERPTNPAIAYSYLRFSTPEQAKGDSIRRQTESTAAWCKRNGVTLDTTLKDEGISSFRGKHRDMEHTDTRALAGFLDAVKKGRVVPGSYLILESLDRLTREEIIPAVNLFTSLLIAGIKVVQLHPTEHVYTMGADMTAVMLALVELSRGHSESKMKSERNTAAWVRKQREAATRIVTHKLPRWVAERDGKLVLDEERAAVVRRLYAMALEGHGASTIARRLNEEGVPVIGRAVGKGGRVVRWANTTVYFVLTTRAAIGEYTPYATHRSKPAGEPVKNYFPPVVDERTYYAVQAALAERAAVGRGRRGKHINLFAGLLRDARGGGQMTYRHRTDEPSTIVPADARDGRGERWVSFPARGLERAIRSELREVKAADITGGNEGASRLDGLTGQRVRLEALRAAWRAKMDDPDIVDEVAAKLAEIGKQLADVNEKIDAARREAANPFADAWDEARTLAGMDPDADTDELRVRIRAALRRCIESVTCLFVPVPKTRARLAAVRVDFKGTGRHRNYLVLHRPTGAGGGVPATSVLTFTGFEGLDIRKAADARKVAALLARLKLDAAGER